MPLKRIGWIAGLILLLGSVSQAAVVPAYTTQYYVSQGGYDGNDGLSTATSFASVTRAVQVLDLVDVIGNTNTVRVVLAAGAYLSDGLTMSWNNFTRVEWEGDTGGAWFIGQTGVVQINNGTSNPLNYLLFINRPAMPVGIYAIDFWSITSNTLVNMIEINSDTVFIQDCRFNYFVNGATSNLESVVRLNGSQNVTLDHCEVFFEDAAGQNTGWVRMLFLDTSTNLAFTDCKIFSNALGGPLTLPHVYAIQTTQASFTRCQVYGRILSAQAFGFDLTSTSFSITLDACGVSQTAIGVLIDQANNVTLQNSWFQNNTIGLRLNNANRATVVNNIISLNSSIGVALDGMCPDSVLFNNIIVNNGGAGGVQLNADYLPGYGSVSVPMPWQSRHNFILQQAGQFVGAVQPPAVGAPLYVNTLKEWTELTGQDALDGSLTYPVLFTTNPLYPNLGEEIWGQGTASFQGRAAPPADFLGQNRPLVGDIRPDIGCVEQGDPSLFNHVGLIPSAATALVGNTLTVDAEFLDSRNLQVAGNPNGRLYFYLQQPGGQFDVEPTGVISSPTLPLQVTGTAGLYFVEVASVPPGLRTFQLNVSRSDLAARAYPFRLRVLEWGNWYNYASREYGGRTDNGGAVMQWTAPLQGQSSSAIAPSPVLASGRPQDHARIQITILDTGGNPVSGLPVTDFTFTVSGGNYNLDLSTFIEDAFNPGTYFINLMSDQVGIKTVTIIASGSLLNDQPQVEFQPGIFGVVSDSAGSLPPDVQVQIADASGTVLGTALTSLTGEYAIRIPRVTNQQYVVTVTDPAGRYTQAERVLNLPLDTALQVDFILDSLRPTRLDGHAYPNPAARGSNVTIRYDLPTPGPFRLEIFDLRGRRLITLIDSNQPAGPGRIVWQAANRFGKQLAPGTYLIVMRFEGKTITKKVVIIP